jgi:hypothetical protein
MISAPPTLPQGRLADHHDQLLPPGTQDGALP